MSTSPTASPTRPRLGARSISQVNPLTTPNKPLGNYSSGDMLPIGSRLPISPFLPLPAASSAPLSPPPTIESKQSLPSSLAMRRMRKHDSDLQAQSSSERPAMKRGHTVNPSSEPRVGLRINTLQAASTPSNRFHSANSPRSAGMTRSYSSPVATQSELDEQRRVMENGKAFWTYGFSGFSSPVTTSPTPIRRDDSPLKAAAASSIQMAPASPLSKRTVLSPLTKAQVSGNVPDTVNESSPIPPQPIFLRKATTIKAVDRENDSENVPPSKEVKDSAMDVDMDSEMSYFSHRKGSVSSSDEDEATTPTPSSYSSPFGAAQSSALNKIRGMEVCQVSNASEVTSNDKWTPYEGFINPAHFN